MAKKQQFLHGSSDFARFMEREMGAGVLIKYSRWDSWREFLTWTLATLQGDEETLAFLAKRFEDLIPVWATWFDALKEAIKADPYCDALGSAYMALGQGSKGFGQYFTVKPVASCMAAMMLHDSGSPDRLERGMEPTCGSGVMVLAAAEILAQRDRLPIVWICMDLDMTCCRMAAIQLYLNDIPALVLCCNSLFFGMAAEHAATVVSPRLWLPTEDGFPRRLEKIHTEAQLHSILDYMEEDVMGSLERRRIAAERAV